MRTEVAFGGGAFEASKLIGGLDEESVSTAGMSWHAERSVAQKPAPSVYGRAVALATHRFGMPVAAGGVNG